MRSFAGTNVHGCGVVLQEIVRALEIRSLERFQRYCCDLAVITKCGMDDEIRVLGEMAECDCRTQRFLVIIVLERTHQRLRRCPGRIATFEIGKFAQISFGPADFISAEARLRGSLHRQ